MSLPTNFKKISPATYEVFTPLGLAGACKDWGGVAALQLPKKSKGATAAPYPIVVKFELVTDNNVSHVLVDCREIRTMQLDTSKHPEPARMFFQDYPDAHLYVDRINHPLVQELLKDPSLLDHAIAFMEGYVPGTDIAVQLNELAIALSDGKHYAYCCIGECTWSGRVKIDASKDFYECPECGELAEIRKV